MLPPTENSHPPTENSHPLTVNSHSPTESSHRLTENSHVIGVNPNKKLYTLKWKALKGVRIYFLLTEH
jgi:hypothetical protein